MNVGKVGLNKIGAACLFVNGVVLLFYALLVPGFVRGVHGLITLVAILFLVATLTIYHSIRRAHELAAKVVAALLAFGMIVIIASDLLYTLSVVTRFSHDLAYALGNAVFVIGVLIIGLITLKGTVLYKWVTYLSLITGIVGLTTYLSLAASFLSTFALLLLGLWSLALGFNINKLSK
ncbi:MAG: hypothetical protein ACLP5V_06395 [Candidatus Bathyarchaeia archaeon]